MGPVVPFSASESPSEAQLCWNSISKAASLVSLGGAVVGMLITPGDPDAQPLGGAAPFPAHDGLDVIDIVHDPDQLFRFHQVERYVPPDLLAVRDHSLGDLPQDRGLDEAGVDAMGVKLGLAQVEVVDVPGEGVFLV